MRPLHEIDDAGKRFRRSVGHLDRNRPRSETLLDARNRRIEVRADAVHLVDERDPRHVVTVGLVPDGLGLRLDALDPVEDHDRAVENAQGAFDLGREIHVPRRVDQIDPMVPPGEGRRGRRDRDPAVALVFAEVHHGQAVVDLA